MSQCGEIAAVVVRLHDRGSAFVHARRKIGRVIDLDHAPTQNFREGTQRHTVRTFAKNQDLNRRLDFLHERVWQRLLFHSKHPRAELFGRSRENRHRATTPTMCEMLRQLREKTFAQRLHENLDAAVAAETKTRVEAHERWCSSANHFQCAARHFLFETSAAERTDCRSVRTDKHPCPGTPVARALRAYQGGQRQRLAAVEFEGADNVDDFFHCRSQQNVRGDSESRFRNVKSTYRV